MHGRVEPHRNHAPACILPRLCDDMLTVQACLTDVIASSSHVNLDPTSTGQNKHHVSGLPHMVLHGKQKHGG